jgi:hypothetical protein
MRTAMPRWISIFALGLFLVASSLRGEQSCSQAALRKTAVQVLAVQARLLAVKVGQGGMDTSVSPSTRAEIHLFKTAINEAIDAFMLCEDVGSKDASGEPKSIEFGLAELLKGNREKMWGTISADNLPAVVDRVYGRALGIKVRAIQQVPLTVAVQVSFGVNCGDDNILLVYEAGETKWQRVLDWQSGDYDEVSGAFGDFFDYQLIPQATQDGWAIAVAHGMPWCTSRWSGFDLDVIQPEHGQTTQKVLMHTNKGYVRENDPVMKATPDGFQLRLEVGTVESVVMTRVGIYRYRVVGGQVERIQPIANNGRDFVDEWLQVPWTEAVKWGDSTFATSLQEEHNTVYEWKETATSDSPFLSYGPVVGCSDRKDHFQMTLFADKLLNQKQIPVSTTYFQIEQGKNSFKMLSASQKADPLCGGGDLMGSH